MRAPYFARSDHCEAKAAECFFRNGWYNRQPKNWAVNLKRIKHSLENNFTRRRILATTISILAALTLSSCWFERETVTRNIRVIIQAKVAGKIVEGSAVMGIRWVPGDYGRMYIRSNIEAVILDLPEYGTVYLLDAFMSDNGQSNGGYWALQLLRSFGIEGNGRLEDFPKLRTLTGRHPVKPIVGRPPTLPVIVSFRDESKLETMFEVRPGDFQEHFGSDVRYHGMWFEFTDDMPTNFLPARLPVALKPNESFYSAFSKTDSEGNLLPSKDYAFSQKLSGTIFYRKGY